MILLTTLTVILLSTQYIGCTLNSTGYLLTFPVVLPAGSKEKFCMILHGSENFKSYTLTLTHQDTEIVEEFNLWTDEGGCKELAIPKKIGKYDIALLETEGQTKLQEMEVDVISGQNLITFVQTDKPIYKPGQKVQFRVLTMKRDLKPRMGKISQVFIKDPNDVRIKQWLDVQSEGLTSLDFQLAEEPLLGEWKIEAMIDGDLTTQTFKVDEYVLPKFEVTIIPPKFLLSNASTVDGEICAKYTYGKPVKGRLEAEICLGGHRTIKSPCASIVVEIDGCYNFSVNASDVGFRKGYYFFRSELKISAEVWESDTGAVVKESHKGPSISFDPLKITLKDDTNKFFKPSFPYHGRAEVTKPDGSVAPGETIEITMINFKHDIRLSKNFTTDKNGIIKFSSCLQPLSVNMPEFSVQARAVEYTDEGGPPSFRLYMPRAYSTIKQWFSPSKSYIQIPNINRTVKCGEEVTLDIPYTTTLDSYTLFHYQVMSRGKMLHTGHKEHHFLKHDATQMLDVPKEECLVLEVENRVPSSPPPPTTSPHPDPTHSTATFGKPNPPTRPTAPMPGPGKLIEEPYRPEVFEPLLEPEIYEPLGMFEPLNSPIRKKRYIMPPNEEEKIEFSDDISTHVSHVKVKFVVTPDMAPHAKLLVYYIREDGETVADSINFNVEKCFRNKVTMGFNDEQVLPGAETIVNIEASPGSLCSIGVVDKSINILGGDHQLTPEKLLDAIEDLDLSKYNHLYNDNDYCERKRKAEKEASEGESSEMADSLYGWFYYSSKYVDAIQAFKEMGLRVMTNLQVESRPCSYSHPVVYDSVPMPMSGSFMPPTKRRQSMSRKMPPSNRQRNIVLDNGDFIRNFFPETWLWNLEKIGESGKLQMLTTAPHTVTKWQGNTLCTSPDVGFGFSPVTSLITFQPFFLSFTLPYSAVREERIPIRVTVFNYLEKCLLMEIKLEVWDEIEIVQGSHQDKPFCLCGGQSHTAKYYIIPLDIGELPITAIAEILPGSCDNSSEMDLNYVGMRDAAQRKILTKAEGVQQEYSLNKYICLDSGKEDVVEQFDLQVPEDRVYDSARGEFTVIGDIMGPALSNLDNLVNQPTGCGEQTMVTFTPNIYVLKYLQSVQQDTEELETLAKNYMEIGYQRELKFRHDDGSFSAFGKADKSGSTWLTAFVIQSFAQAREFIYIDTKDLEKSIKFIRTRARLENGCFREVGQVFSSYMMGGLDTSKDSSLTTLTAYVLISLLEAEVSKEDPMIIEGMRCLNAQEPTEDVYTMSVLTYANVLFDVNSTESVQALDRLNEHVIKNGNIEHWARKGAKPKPVNSWYYFVAPSAEVEMTAYGLLARLHSTDNIGDVVPLAMWMSQQRNSFGGYTSTQDTVVGLHALSEFAAMLNKDSDGESTEGLKILFQGDSLETALNVTSENALLLQTVNLKELPNFVEVTAEGRGCALVQANVRYNKYPDDLDIEEDIFSLKVTTRREENDCALKAMEICVSFNNHEGYSDGMSLVTVTMVTGWSVEPKSLRKLRSRFSLLNMKKYEIDNTDGSINFYFDELDHRKRCFKFDLIQNKDLAVSAPKSGIVKVFQYYEKEVSAVQSYDLKTICGTKEELPIKPPQVLPPMDETVIMQRRVTGNQADIGRDDPIVQERVNPLSRQREREVPAQPKIIKCPVCVNTPPENLNELVCQSGSILKVSAGRNGRVTMKLKADLRPRRKQRLDQFVSVEFNKQCKCDLIKPPKGQKRVKRLLVFTESPNLFDKEGQKEKAFDLTKAKYVINLDLDKKLERRVRILSRKCPSP